MDNRNDSGKGWAIGFGLLAGIAIGYYLNSNEGRAARRRAQVQFDEYGNQVKEYGQELSSRATELAKEAKEKGRDVYQQAVGKIEQGKEWAAETANSVKNAVGDKAQAVKSSAAETAHEVESSFQRGVNKAKANVDTKFNSTN